MKLMSSDENVHHNIRNILSYSENHKAQSV